MATCKDCIHYDICIFHLKGNENEKCVQFINTADVVPRELYDEGVANWQKIHGYTADCLEHYNKGRREVAREIFEEIEVAMWKPWGDLPDTTRIVNIDAIAELKKKYTEEKEK